MGVIAAIFLGGGLGATARYGLGLATARLWPDSHLPWGTLAANVIGCALLGLLAALFLTLDWPRPVKLGLTTGVLGGLSEAMVRFAARYEMAQSVEDVLARRCRLLFLDAAEAARQADAVATILADELEAAGICPGTVRMSCGLEHVDDLVTDVCQALDAVLAGTS